MRQPFGLPHYRIRNEVSMAYGRVSICDKGSLTCTLTTTPKGVHLILCLNGFDKMWFCTTTHLWLSLGVLWVMKALCYMPTHGCGYEGGRGLALPTTLGVQMLFHATDLCAAAVQTLHGRTCVCILLSV